MHAAARERCARDCTATHLRSNTWTAQRRAPGAAGVTLIELLFVLGIIAVLAAAAVPQVLVSLDRSRGLGAARYLGTRLALARTQAAARGAAVALQFLEGPRGVSFSAYQDGNRNGVRTAEIASGIDRQIEPAVSLSELFPGAAIGLVPGSEETDPIQIGRSNLMSFSPSGTSTPGTIYVRGADGTQWAVRVLGATGRTRVLRFDPAKDDWVNAF